MVFRYPDGTNVPIKLTETDVWLLIDGSWKIVHLHYYVPVEPIE